MSMSQLTLCLAFHNHQPVGNFPWVFEESYRHSYLPMLESLERHPSIRVSLHYTGPLYDWFEHSQPDFVDRLATLVERNQIELMTGGYYEPILPSIPEADRLGQIQMMTDYLLRRFGSKPTGMWLAERVWEPQLASTLPTAGVDWTIVDDTHFKMTGLGDDDLFGYHVTEDQGKLLKIFATSKRLRYIIPWAPVNSVIDELRAWAGDETKVVAVMGDDGEKFGVWPGTYDYCWTDGWIDRFFQAVADNASWLRLIPVGEFANQQPARGRVYLPTASYAEMLEWALPARAGVEFSRVYHEAEAQHRDDVARFLRGGFWRSFLVKYDEVNTMHKKMLRANRKAYATAAALGTPDRLALDQLWQAQCNCPYWHGVFGGIYMTDVRTATFQHLIRSERRSNEILHRSIPWLAVEVVDFDCDSRDEVVVESSRASYYLDPARGGSLFEWDSHEPDHNLVSVMTRREEAYHLALRRAAEQSDHAEDSGVKTIHDVVRMKEAGLEKLLTYDRYRRACLLDHFLDEGARPEDFAHSTFEELGDFTTGAYQPEIEFSATSARISLTRSGRVGGVSASRVPVTVAKTLSFDAAHAGFDAGYLVTNNGVEPLQATFGVELNLNLLGGGGNPSAFRRFSGEDGNQRFDVPAQSPNVEHVFVGNNYLGIKADLGVSRPARAWWSSIETVSSSEGGFERVHQGGSLLLSWPIHLGPGESWQVELKASVGALDRDAG
jgi:alpha-amylase